MPTENSSSWYRVAEVKPKLQDHITIHRHEYRHQAWFVLQDRHKARSHRFNHIAYFVISCMTGQRSMQEIWQISQARFKDEPPTQDEIIQLLAKLYQNELIHTDVTPNIEELSQRNRQSRKQRLKQYFMNPLGLRFPLYNPTRLLEWGIRYVEPLFKKRLFHGWLLLTGLALILMFINWPELSTATTLHAFTTQNMLLFLFIYPLIKLLHELGHAFAIKHYDGEVTEMGIMIMVFVPVPYVNAHSAMALPDKKQRMLVSAMGIIVESTLASIALLIWLNIEPGLLRNICLDVMLIGGLSSLLANGNPLIKFDAYHVLADAIESPNLATRAKKYLSYKLHLWLFKIDRDDDGLMDDREAIWFFNYALASFAYRIFLTLTILALVLDKFYAAGVVLAVWALSLQVVMPFLRYIHTMAHSEQVTQNKSRVYSVIGVISLVLLIGLFVIPVPQTSSTQGIIWISEEMQLKAKSPGFIRKLLVENNQLVQKGDALIITEDPLLAGRVKKLEAKLRELKVKLASKRHQHLESEQLKQEMERTEAEFELFKHRLASLTLQSPANGRLVIPDYLDLPDQFVEQGQLIGFIIEPDHLVAQIIIPEQEIALFQQQQSRFEIRQLGSSNKTITANYKRIIPEAIKQLPSAALGIKGGGDVLVDPGDNSGRTPIEKVFQLELSIPANQLEAYIGSRVRVRVKHGNLPLARQWGRSLQQLLLGRVHV